MDLTSSQAVLVNDPLFFQNVCDYVAGGGTLVEYCALHELSYPAVLRWIRTDVTRRDLYERAKEDGDQWQIDKIRCELRDLGDIDLSLMFDDQGKTRPFHLWPHKLQRSVREIETTDEGVKIKFHDKLKALELMGRTSGMFKEKIVHEGKVTLEALVSQSMAPKKVE